MKKQNPKTVAFAGIVFAWLFVFPRPAQSAPPSGAAAYFSPASQLFSCTIPKGWTAFEEGSGDHPPVHVMGPDDPLGLYRAGIDVHFFEKGDPGFVNAAAVLRRLRREGPSTERTLTSVRPQRVAGTIALTFEVTEKRWLPLEGLPSSPQYLHRYIALVPQGSNYYVVSLSSTRTAYLDLKETFAEFLKSFQTLQSPTQKAP